MTVRTLNVRSHLPGAVGWAEWKGLGRAQMTARLLVEFLAVAASTDQIFIRPNSAPIALRQDENDTHLAPGSSWPSIGQRTN